jgi:selenocysteine-specific elongation factor
MKHLIIGTAGHIDHGKTQLIKALTGTDTDRLREEKERGISIDLGFAEYRIGEELLLGVVDVPGHESFIRNMLAGVTGIDLVLFVIAADEGIMPQTVEHLEILELLHTKRGVVALTKVDLVEGEWLELVEDEIREALRGTFLERAAVLRVSAKTGEGIEPLKRALADAASGLEERRTDDLFRMPVDRAFTLKGVGTVVTGTVWAGRVMKDDIVRVLPSGQEARVKSLEVHDRKAEESSAGSRTALALTGLAKEDITRGDTIVREPVWDVTDCIDVHLECLASESRGIENRRRIRFHLATQEVMGRVLLLEGAVLERGKDAYAQLRLEKPIVTRKGDRFVMRSYSPMRTIGGGTVLAPFAARRTRMGSGDAALFDVLTAGGDEEEVRELVRHRGPAGLLVSRLPLLVSASLQDLRRTITGLEKRGDLRVLDEYVFHKSALDEAREKIRTYLQDLHRSNPLKTGFPLEEMRKKVLHASPDRMIEEVIGSLSREGFLDLKGGLVRLTSHEISLDREEVRIRDEVVRRFGEAGLAPPSLSQIVQELGVSESKVHAIVAILKESGDLVQITTDILFARSALVEAEEKVKGFLRERGKSPASEIRTMLGGSRKYIIPLLEFFDRKGLTRREGDYRVLRGDHSRG